MHACTHICVYVYMCIYSNIDISKSNTNSSADNSNTTLMVLIV